MCESGHLASSTDGCFVIPFPRKSVTRIRLKILHSESNGVTLIDQLPSEFASWPDLGALVLEPARELEIRLTASKTKQVKRAMVLDGATHWVCSEESLGGKVVATVPSTSQSIVLVAPGFVPTSVDVSSLKNNGVVEVDLKRHTALHFSVQCVNGLPPAPFQGLNLELELSSNSQLLDEKVFGNWTSRCILSGLTSPAISDDLQFAGNTASHAWAICSDDTIEVSPLTPGARLTLTLRNPFGKVIWGPQIADIVESEVTTVQASVSCSSLVLHVWGPQGQPLQGADVLPMWPNADCFSVFSVHDDPPGAYAFSAVPCLPTQVLVQATGFVPQVVSVDQSRTSTRLDVVLESGRRVTAKVVNDAGIMLCDESVRIWADRPGYGTIGGDFFAERGEDCTYRLPPLPYAETRVCVKLGEVVHPFTLDPNATEPVFVVHDN
jgi:hypothetical protein